MGRPGRKKKPKAGQIQHGLKKGRPKKITPADETIIQGLVAQHGALSDAELRRIYVANGGTNVSTSTWCRTLNQFSSRFTKVPKPVLNANGMSHRLDYVATQLSLLAVNPLFLHSLAFGDEKWWEKGTNSTIRLIQGQEFRRFSSENPRKPRLMYLCVVLACGASLSIELPSVVDSLCFIKMLHEHVFPFLLSHNITTLVLDNAPIHKSHLCSSWFATQPVKVHFIPPHSPDLNPIETLFSLVSRELTSRLHGIWNKDQLRALVPFYFQKGAKTHIHSLLSKLQYNYKAVMNCKGGNYYKD